MATIKSVTLNFANEPTADQKKAVVSYTFHFNAADVGKQFRVAIQLWADDSGESPPRPYPIMIPPPLPLFTFRFGPFFLRKDYFIVTPTAAGDLTGSKEANVGSDVLNEDPETIEITLPGGKKVKLPQPDEIFASISLLPVGDEQHARSATKRLLL